MVATELRPEFTDEQSRSHVSLRRLAAVAVNAFDWAANTAGPSPVVAQRDHLAEWKFDSPVEQTTPTDLSY